MNLNCLKLQLFMTPPTSPVRGRAKSPMDSSMGTPTKRAGSDMGTPTKRAGSYMGTPTKRAGSDMGTPTKRAGSYMGTPTKRAGSPSPTGMEKEKGEDVVSEHSGSFSPVVVIRNRDGSNHVKKRFYVAGENVKSKTMSGLKTQFPKYNIMPWTDWLKNKHAHMDYTGPASMHFVKTYGVITTIKDGGDDGLSIFEMEMEYVLPVLDFLSSNPDKRNDLARLYFTTLVNINNALLKDGVVLEDVHPRNCGLRFLQDGTFELVFFDLQFSAPEKGINVPSEYVFEMTSDLTGNERKALKKRQALLLMVESINRYDPVRPRKEHLQEIAHELNIGCMSLEQVDLALGAFL
jgi:hypothetical protein